MKDENWIKSGIFEEKPPTSIKDKTEGKTHIFCHCGSIGYFHQNLLLLRISRWRFDWCWIKRLRQQLRTEESLRRNVWLLRKNRVRKLNLSSRKYGSFTWAANGLILRSLFLVVAFWVAPWTTLCFGDWHVIIMGAAWVFINFFNEGTADPNLATGHGGR